MNIGFTGTRWGCTGPQRDALKKLILQFKQEGILDNALHGDCIGADTDFHNLIRIYGNALIYIHPPLTPTYDDQWWWAQNKGSFVMPAKSHLARNRDIVNRSDIMIACPSQTQPQSRGGTWWTIKYAQCIKKPVYTIYPDGKIIKKMKRAC